MTKAFQFTLRYLVGLACSIYLFTLGVVVGRNRGLIGRICKHFGFFLDSSPEAHSKAEGLTLPKVRIEELSEPVPLTLLEPMGVRGNVALEEIVAICTLVRKHGCRRVFEIGTFDGRTTLNMAANTPDDAEVYTLDLPREQLTASALEISDADAEFVDKPVSGARFLTHPLRRKIRQLFGDSATFAFGPYKGQIDMVFVDGAHTHDYVLSDTERALECVGERGVVLWHDYNVDLGQDVPEALHHLQATDPRLAGLRHIEGTSLAVLIVGE